ncbi:MAG TPA: DinB family protein, partial [Roseiflexaceae bacterium]|nr:DinB family protein [Roseiflexaceae bacterium]
VRQMLSTDNPQLQRANNDVVRQRDYQNKQIGFLLITLAERRAEFVELLRMLRPAQLTRPGLHPTRGAITVADAPAALDDHDRGHRAQIAANLEAFKRSGGR